MSEESRQIALEILDEATASKKLHNPWRNRGSRGPGPRGGKSDSEAKKWNCTCKGHVCACVGIAKSTNGKKKTVKIKKSWKDAYNKEYKAWRKSKKTAE